MPNITLPDGSVRSFENSITGFQLATDIGPGLAKAALIMLVDGVELDLDQEIDNDSKVAFITRSDDLAKSSLLVMNATFESLSIS